MSALSSSPYAPQTSSKQAYKLALDPSRCYDVPQAFVYVALKRAGYGVLFVIGSIAFLVPALGIVALQLAWKAVFKIPDSEVYPSITSPPNAPPYHRSKPSKFTLLTYNIAGLPPQYNINPPWRRLKEYCRRLNDAPEEDQPDVICFQEAFSIHVNKNIIGKTLTRYPYKVIEPIPHPPGLPLIARALQLGSGSGLCIVSKFPILSCEAKPYGISCGADYQANKGYVTATLDLGSGRTATVITTHMQSDKTNDPLWWFTSNPHVQSKSVKATQLGILSEAMEKERGREKDAGFLGVVMCGDLNVPGESVEESGAGKYDLKPTAEYKNMITILPPGSIDCYRTLHPLSVSCEKETAGFTIDGPRNLDDNPDELSRLDYVFSLSTKLQCERATVYEGAWTDMFEGGIEAEDAKEGRRKCFSDHSGVKVEFKVL